MIDCSDLFKASMAYSRTMFTEMDIVYNGTILENEVPGPALPGRGVHRRA
jgi:hypothetical protein